MTDKKPLNEGFIRGSQKGEIKPTGQSSNKPIQPPPAPTPKKPQQ